MDWYVLTLIALSFYTVQGILFKFAALKKCDKTLTTFYYLLTVTTISIPFILFYGVTQITLLGLIIAVVNGVFYMIDTVMRIEALKFIPASIVYPIIRLDNAALVVLFILFLGESVTLQNFIGIVIAIFSLFLLSKGDKDDKIGKRGGRF